MSRVLLRFSRIFFFFFFLESFYGETFDVETDAFLPNPNSLVDTPLWTPDLRDQWSYTDEARAQTASTIAEAIMDLVQNGKYVGGDVMVSIRSGGNVVLEQERYWEPHAAELERSSLPVRAILEKERGGKGAE